jgi:hypothetical protein
LIDRKGKCKIEKIFAANLALLFQSLSANYNHKLQNFQTAEIAVIHSLNESPLSFFMQEKINFLLFHLSYAHGNDFCFACMISYNKRTTKAIR